MIAVSSIKGQPLSGVAFVQDYVEFHFDGKILRALTPVSITLRAQTFTFPGEGSRDALCSVIGRVVRDVDVREDDRIEVLFDNGAVVRIPLGHKDRAGPEAAHFVPGVNLPMEVW